MTRRQSLTLVAAILGSGVAAIDGSIVAYFAWGWRRPRGPAQDVAARFSSVPP